MSKTKKRQQPRDAQSEESDEEEQPPAKKQAVKVPAGGWQQGLLASMNDPECKVFEDELVVVIKDKYPKARYHFLVMPKEKIDHLHQLTSKHVELLQHMNQVGNQVASEHDELDLFRLGFHARASMGHLHMHVISQDFDSLSMKTKKHWNSFTSEFFRSFDSILNELKEKGKIARPDPADCDALLKRPLSCHKCEDGKTFPTMPKLKDHLKSHEKNDDKQK